MTFETPDMSGWTDAQRADYYYENRDHFNEIFSGEKATFVFDPYTTTTTREVVMTLREARAYDAKQRTQARMLQHQ